MEQQRAWRLRSMTCFAHPLNRLRRGTPPRRRLHQEQRCSSASPPISLFVVLRRASVTAPSLPPGDGSVFGTGSWPVSSGPTVQLDHRSPRCRRNDNHVFASRFRRLVALTSQSLVEEARLICLRRVQGSCWYHSCQNSGSLPSQCSVGKGARVFSRVAHSVREVGVMPPRSSLLPPSWRGAIRLFRRILTSHSQGPMVQVRHGLCLFLSFFWSSSV